MLEFNNLEEMKPYFNKESNTYIFNDNVTFNFSLIVPNLSIKARNINARNIKASNIIASNINARNIDACDIIVSYINAKNINAWHIDIIVRNINARNIDACDIVVRNINEYLNVNQLKKYDKEKGDE